MQRRPFPGGRVPRMELTDMAMDAECIRATALRYTYTSDSLLQMAARTHHPYPGRTASLDRRIDFLAGRICAEQALRRAGLTTPATIGTGPRGEPLWPPGFHGSISHGDGLAIASVAPATQLDALGIDVQAKFDADVVNEIHKLIATPEEMEVRDLRMTATEWLTVIFSAKESLFKALYPHVGNYFEFLDVGICRVLPSEGRLILCLKTTLSQQHACGQAYEVTYQWVEQHALTCCAI
jgi:enterobactin synthetase component D